MALFPNRGAGTALARIAPEPKRLIEHAPVTAKVETPQLETKGIPVFSYPLELFFDMFRDNPDLVTVRKAMRAYALCYRCLEYRATKLIEPPLWIVDETNDGEAWLQGEHPLSHLLEMPNPDMEMQEFLQLVSYYLDLEGASLIVKSENMIGETAMMYPFRRSEFMVEPTRDRLYGRFQVQTFTGTENLGPDRVIFLRNTDPHNIFQVISPTDVALSHINLGVNMVTAIKAALRNSTKPGGIITVVGDLGDEGFKRLKAEVQTNYAGVYNAGKTILLEGGATYAEAKGGTLKEMALGPLQEDVETAICSAYGMHPVLVGAKVGVQATSGMSDSIKPLQDLFYDSVIFPRWGYIDRAFTRSLLRPIDPRPRRFIRFDKTKVRALQVDMTARVTEAAGAAGFWKIDEQRAHTLKAPLPKGQGDQLAGDRQHAQDIEAQQLAADNNAAQAEADRRAAQKSLDAMFPETKVATVFLGQAARNITPEQLKKAWEAFDTKAASDEDAYEREALEQFAVEERSVIDILERSVPDFKAIGDDVNSSVIDPYIRAAELRIAAAYGPAGTYYKQWLRRYRTLISTTAKKAGSDLLSQLGLDFNITNTRFQAAIQRRVNKLAGNVTETTLQKIRDIIGDSRRDGVGVRELADRIRSGAFNDQLEKSRATTIARTETVGALNEGETIAAQESGVFRSKKWVSQRVGDARQEHMDEEDVGFVPINSPYHITKKMAPHDGIGGASQDINCRCSQLFSDLDPIEANEENAPQEKP